MCIILKDKYPSHKVKHAKHCHEHNHRHSHKHWTTKVIPPLTKCEIYLSRYWYFPPFAPLIWCFETVRGSPLRNYQDVITADYYAILLFLVGFIQSTLNAGTLSVKQAYTIKSVMDKNNILLLFLKHNVETSSILVDSIVGLSKIMYRSLVKVFM